MEKILLLSAATMLSGIAALAQAPPPPPPAPPPAGNVMFYQPLEKAEVFHHDLKPVVNAPYQGTMVNETVQHLADGNTIENSHTSKVARDSQGRTWREETLDRMGPWSTASGPTTVVFVSDPVAGYSYVLHPDKKTASRRPMPKKVVLSSGKPAPSAKPAPGAAAVPALPAEPPVPPSDVEVFSYSGTAGAIGNVATAGPVGPDGPMKVEMMGHSEVTDSKSESLGTQEVNGVLAQGKRTTRTIAAGKVGNQLPITIVSETWYSPDLQMIVMSKHSDPRFGETTFQVENIQRGEPAADLFEVPGDYTVTDEPGRRLFRFKQ